MPLFWGWTDVWVESALMSPNLRYELSNIHVPILVMRGSANNYGTQVETVIDLRPCALRTVINPESDHVPHREKPEHTLDAIAQLFHSDDGVLRSDLPSPSTCRRP